MPDIHKRISELKAQLRDTEARAAAQARRDHTRRRILYGAAALKLLDDLPPALRAELLQSLHAHVTRSADRRFLGPVMEDEPSPLPSPMPAHPVTQPEETPADHRRAPVPSPAPPPPACPSRKPPPDGELPLW